MSPQSWNRYLYVENNPVNLIDPSGLKTCFEAECSSSEGEDSSAPEAAQRGISRWDSMIWSSQSDTRNIYRAFYRFLPISRNR